MLLGVFLPFFNWVSLVLFSRRLGKLGAIYVTSLSCILTVIINLYNFAIVHSPFVKLPVTYFFNLGPWIQVSLLQIDWEFMLDTLSTSMLLMVSIISGLVHFYSFSYMKTDPHFLRFISYLSLFTFFMFVLVSAANLVVFFVGWEGVGICSYLLINFWYTRGQANKAALKALLMNRVGDIGFLLGVVLLFAISGSVDFGTLRELTAHLDFYWDISYVRWFFIQISQIDMVCFCFFIGVVGKSAQLGLHTWLPAAMEGPTPVSALIHAATMVTAGIFLLIRCAFLFECSTMVRTLIVVGGAFTAFFSAITAMFLFDIKKIIAYSTCSQLGYMAVACGLSHYTLGLFHLINHAFFKALLFLTAGAIIHSFNNEQDIRKLSNIAEKAPFLHACMLIGSVAIMGLPFLSGFYSKDLIIEIVYNQTIYLIGGSTPLYCLIMGATLCTGVYSLRLYYFLFLRQGTTHMTGGSSLTSLQQPFFIQFSLSCLLVGSIFSGYFLSEFFFPMMKWSVGDNYYCNYCRPKFWENSFFETEFLPWTIKLLPLSVNVFVVFLGLLLIHRYQSVFSKNKVVHWLWAGIFYTSFPEAKEQWLVKMSWLNNATAWAWWVRSHQLCINSYRFYFEMVKMIQVNFYFNEVYNFFAATQIWYYYSIIFINMDKGGLEIFGPTGLERVMRGVIRPIRWYYNRHFGYFITIIYYTVLVCIFLFEWF